MLHVHREDSFGKDATSSSSSSPRSPSNQDASQTPSSTADLEMQKREGLLPTYHSVPFPVVLSQVEVSLASLEKITSYIDERWKLEYKYAKERSRLKLELRHGIHPDDTLENCLQGE